MVNLKEIVSIVMIQPLPLPGSYKNNGQSIEKITEKVIKEVKLVNEAGFDSIILQNMGDMPVKQVSRPEAIAFMSVIAKEIKRRFPNLTLGILINWDGVASLAAAEAANADFVRVEHVYTGVEVTSTGLFTAQCCEILELKKRIQSKIPIFADVYEPHGVPLGAKSIEDAAWEAVNEASADGLFLSGKTPEKSIEMVEKARKKVPNTPILLGGGATAENVIQLLQHFDGVCVGTWIKNGSLANPIDSDKAKIFIEKVNFAKLKRLNI
jgi:membrane complex biogenesis BtpA family protein